MSRHNEAYNGTNIVSLRMKSSKPSLRKLSKQFFDSQTNSHQKNWRQLHQEVAYKDQTGVTSLTVVLHNIIPRKMLKYLVINFIWSLQIKIQLPIAKCACHPYPIMPLISVSTVDIQEGKKYLKKLTQKSIWT